MRPQQRPIDTEKKCRKRPAKRQKGPIKRQKGPIYTVKKSRKKRNVERDPQRDPQSRLIYV